MSAASPSAPRATGLARFLPFLLWAPLLRTPGVLRADVLAVLGHVWYSSLIAWANGRSDFDRVIAELERACRVLIRPHERHTG